MRDGETPEEFLERIPSFAKQKSSLSGAREFLKLLGRPDRKFQVFHVAGTNGKGSVCAFLTSALSEAGYSVGTFTSPHLVDVKERFALDGETARDALVSDAFYAVLDAAETWTEAGNPFPTYFEFLFYMAMELFSEAGVEIAVVETGMGGRYDVTNVLENPLVSVITSIGLDHTAFLGGTVSEIAAHKAGIIKAGRPVVYDASDAAASAVIREQAASLSCEAHAVGPVGFSWNGDSLEIAWTYAGKECEFQIPSPAPYQAVNAALAVTALSVSGLDVPEWAVRGGIRKTKWPARMEEVSPGVYLDGAHNEAGIGAFLDAACRIKESAVMKAASGRGEGPARGGVSSRGTGQEAAAGVRVWLMFSAAADKDYGRMLEEIEDRLAPDELLFVQVAGYSRGLSGKELSLAAERIFPSSVRVRDAGTVASAFPIFRAERGENDLLFIAGSLYLAGEVKKLLDSGKNGPAELGRME